jgi:CTP-dependent riboflavin kinase
MINVVTKDGRLTKQTEYTIRTFANMGVNVKQTLERALSKLRDDALVERVFGEEVKIVNGKRQTTADRIIALEQILKALE